MDPSLSPPSSSITTSASAPSTYRGVATGQLCLRLACLPPDKAETVSLERTGLPVLELCTFHCYNYYAFVLGISV